MAVKSIQHGKEAGPQRIGEKSSLAEGPAWRRPRTGKRWGIWRRHSSQYAGANSHEYKR
jgi:hypothetical protein